MMPLKPCYNSQSDYAPRLLNAFAFVQPFIWFAHRIPRRFKAYHLHVQMNLALASEQEEQLEGQLVIFTDDTFL
jgi:hypothetical protein